MVDCGIGSIVNKRNGKRFIFKSKDLSQCFDNYILQLELGCHFNSQLQKDWLNFGSENFSIEIREITLNDDNEINERYIHHINILSNSYNVLDSKKLFIYELDSKIEILTDRLKKCINSQKFKNKLSKLNLSEIDCENFKKTMISKIKTSEINYYNFDLEVDLLLEEISKIKQENIKNTKKEGLYEYLYSIIGNNNPTSHFKQMLENRDLTLDIGSLIRLELKELIDEEKITTKWEIDNKLDEILLREQNKKIKLDEQRELEIKNQKLALDKLYSLTGDLIPKPNYIYKLNSLNLSIDEGTLIKKEIERKIKLNQLKFEDVEFELNNQIEIKVKENKKAKQEMKSYLRNYTYDIIGEESIHPDFKSELSNHDLHENIGFQIQKKILTLIENENIKDSSQIRTKINNEILIKEKEDVELRLNDLSKNEIDIILRNNNVNTFIPLKQTKITKLINIVPLNIIKENIALLGHDISPIFKENPKYVFCTECGFKNTSDSRFCSECGNKLDE